MGQAAQAPVAPDSGAPGLEQPSAAGGWWSDWVFCHALGGMHFSVLSTASGSLLVNVLAAVLRTLRHCVCQLCLALVYPLGEKGGKL